MKTFLNVMSATCSLLAKGEGPAGYVKYLQCVNEKKSSLKKKRKKEPFSPDAVNFLQVEAGLHSYNDPLIIHATCIILFCF